MRRIGRPDFIGGSMVSRRPRLASVMAAGSLAFMACQVGGRAALAIDVLTQHYDNARLGATLSETILNASTVTTTTFGKLWSLYTDGQVVAQPLYVAGLQVDTTANPSIPPAKGR